MKKLIVVFIFLFGLIPTTSVLSAESRISNFKATTDPVSANPSNYTKTLTFTFTSEAGDEVLSNFKVECDTSKSGSTLLVSEKREFKCSYPKTPVVPYTVRLTPLAANGEQIGLPAQLSVMEADTTTPKPPATTSDYTPQNVVDCKVSDTVTQINWTTTGPVMSGLEWSLPGKTGTPIFGSQALKVHSLKIKGLTKGTKYGYAIYIPLPGETTITKTKHANDQYRQFTADVSSDPAKCNPDGTSKDTPGGTIDTTIGIKCENGRCDFDKTLGTLFNPLTSDMTSPAQIIVRFINIALLLVGIIAILFIIIGGFLMVTSAGNEDRIRRGKQTLIWAVAGLILSLLSFSIVAMVQSIIT